MPIGHNMSKGRLDSPSRMIKPLVFPTNGEDGNRNNNSGDDMKLSEIFKDNSKLKIDNKVCEHS